MELIFKEILFFYLILCLLFGYWNGLSAYNAENNKFKSVFLNFVFGIFSIPLVTLILPIFAITKLTKAEDFVWIMIESFREFLRVE